MPIPTNKDAEALRQEIRNLKVYQAATNARYPSEETLTRFQKNWEEQIINLVTTAMAEAEPKEFKPILFNLVEKHFPKGKSKERGAAMVLVAEALLAIGFANEEHHHAE